MTRRIIYLLAGTLCVGLSILMIGVQLTWAGTPDLLTPRETANALTTQISATGVALKSGLHATQTAVKQNIGGTTTALAATVTALRVNLGGTATAIYSTLDALRTKYAVTPFPGEEAVQALDSYSASVLGLTSDVKVARGYTATIDNTGVVPKQITTAQLSAIDLAVTGYAGLLSNGNAWLVYGNGSVTTNIPIEVQNASLGVWTLDVSGHVTDSASALALAKTTFPGLSGFAYTPAQINKGYGFYSISPIYVIDPHSNQLVLTNETVLLTIQSGVNGGSVIAAAVGRGQYATVLKP